MKIGILAAATALMAGEAMAVSGGGFSLSVRDHADDRSGYVRMQHATSYALCFRNDLNRAADAEVSIDGLPMGTWRLSGNRSACIERPADDTGRFTFYRAESSEGYSVGSGQVSRNDKGRVSVRFIPEIERGYPLPTPYDPPMPYAQKRSTAEDSMTSAAPSYSAPAMKQRQAMPSPERELGAGVTGLSGESGQRFANAGAIERDLANAVTLELRLVHDPVLDRPVDPLPLPGRYNSYAPPPVGN